MNTLLFIYNAVSGKGNLNGKLVNILDIFTKSGFLVTAYPTQGKGDATRAAKLWGGQFDRVVCSGGDGTLSETVAGLVTLEQPPVLGYIPVGSTNDCAATFCLPLDGEDAAALAAGAGIPRPCDVGKLNGHTFVYVAAFGAFTEVAYDTPQEWKNTFGHLAYFMAGIASISSITPYHLRIEYDEQEIEDDFLYGMVCNTISVAGIKSIPFGTVALDDGLFEVVLVRRPVSLTELTAALQSILQHTTTAGSPVLSFHASNLKFICDQPIPWTLDGEYGGCQEISVVENQKQAITMIQGK